MTTGTQLRAWRRANSLTLRQAAALFCRSQRTYQDLEARGDDDLPLIYDKLYQTIRQSLASERREN